MRVPLDESEGFQRDIAFFFFVEHGRWEMYSSGSQKAADGHHHHQLTALTGYRHSSCLIGPLLFQSRIHQIGSRSRIHL